MFTFLDLLVVVFLALAALSLLSLCLMFLIRNKTAKRVFFYISTVFGIYIASIAFRISSGFFPAQTGLAIVTALMCIGAFVVERVGKNNDKMFLIARLIAAAALVIGFFNAIL
jgi:hypothetical protein